MQRDGATLSLWQQGIPDPSFSYGAGAGAAPDVVIVGGGITGLTTALLLQKAGKKCLVVDAYSLCFGTTGGTTAHINTFFDTSYDVVQQKFGKDNALLLAQAALQSRELFRQNVEEHHIDCNFEEKDGYLFALDEQQASELETLYQAAKETGVEVEQVQQIPLSIPFVKAVVFRRQAQLHPTRYVLALAQAFQELGGMIREHCPVEGVEKKDDGLHIHTAGGVVRAQALVYASHTPPGINWLHFCVAPYRSYVVAATLGNNANLPAMAYDMSDPYHYYRTETIDGTNYLIAGGEDHKTGHEANPQACFNHLIAHLRRHFDIESITHRWSSQYFEPADGLPYIGHLPGHPDNVYVATGFGGNGIVYSHIAALTLRDLLTKGESELAALFNPARIKPAASFESFVKENADVVAQFVGRRLGIEKIEGMASLAGGEGRLIKYEGRSLAVYKDETGKLYALNPVCTHAKCIVGWNSAEKSWDCPCHGARYSIEGEVLTGPARQGLEKINLSE